MREVEKCVVTCLVLFYTLFWIPAVYYSWENYEEIW